MKYFAAFLTLIPALLLFGLAYHGYADASTSSMAGPGFDHFAARASNGFSIEGAERQSRLVMAGMEGLLGFAFLYAALAASAASKPRTTGAFELKRVEAATPQYSQSSRADAPPSATPAQVPTERRARRRLIPSGRVRVEELRRARNSNRGMETR